MSVEFAQQTELARIKKSASQTSTSMQTQMDDEEVDGEVEEQTPRASPPAGVWLEEPEREKLERELEERNAEIRKLKVHELSLTNMRKSFDSSKFRCTCCHSSTKILVFLWSLRELNCVVVLISRQCFCPCTAVASLNLLLLMFAHAMLRFPMQFSFQKPVC
ncbi:hypothetical protein XENOCAPTIV_003722 [Xenoophorus captivus]|uniref:Uncharacterized protein n=1 Tax=Xenoophorus captivus TaxID=1517983 RepID=A0ABV0QMF2_9TELE